MKSGRKILSPPEQQVLGQKQIVVILNTSLAPRTMRIVD